MNYLVKKLGIILVVVACPVFGFQCLAAGFPVSNSEIRKLVPELTNPRIMQLSDLNSQQRTAFTAYGFSFWLRGDFNMDQHDDIVIAGHFDNIKNRDDQAFILVLTKFGNHWRRQYFLRPEAPVVSLSYEDHPDAEKRKKGFRAFIANFTIEPSDDFAFIFWDGNQYAVRSGFRHP